MTNVRVKFKKKHLKLFISQNYQLTIVLQSFCIVI